VGSPDAVVYIPNREVNGMILVVAGSNRSCCFVAPEYDRDKYCSVCVDISRNEVLLWEG